VASESDALKKLLDTSLKIPNSDTSEDNGLQINGLSDGALLEAFTEFEEGLSQV
jgi:hypothetical protein